MHEQISIIKLEIDSNFVELIYPYIDKLRAIKVQSNKSCGQSLLDVITLNLNADRVHSLPSISQFFEDEEWNNLNPIYESFKTVKKYYHEWYYKNKKINLLNLIK